MDEQEANAQRAAFLTRLEEVSRGVVVAAETFTVASKRLAARLQRIDESLDEINDHITNFEEFMQSFVNSYDGDAQEARDGFLEMLRHAAEIAKNFRKK